jgi:hypothetical protein
MYKKLLGIALFLGTLVIAEENKAENPFESAKKDFEGIDTLSPEDSKASKEVVLLWSFFLRNANADKLQDMATLHNVTIDELKRDLRKRIAYWELAGQWKVIAAGLDACQNRHPDGSFSEKNRSECEAALALYGAYAWEQYSAGEKCELDLHEKMCFMVNPSSSVVSPSECFLPNHENRLRDPLDVMLTWVRKHQGLLQDESRMFNVHTEEVESDPFEAAKKSLEGIDKYSLEDIKASKEAALLWNFFLWNASPEKLHDMATLNDVPVDEFKRDLRKRIAYWKIVPEWKAIAAGFDACKNPKSNGFFSQGNRSTCQTALNGYKRYTFERSRTGQNDTFDLYEKMDVIVNPPSSVVTTPESCLTADEARVRDHLRAMPALTTKHQDPFKDAVRILTIHRQEIENDPSLKTFKKPGDKRKSVEEFLTQALKSLNACSNPKSAGLFTRDNQQDCRSGITDTRDYQRYSGNALLNHLIQEMVNKNMAKK